MDRKDKIFDLLLEASEKIESVIITIISFVLIIVSLPLLERYVTSIITLPSSVLSVMVFFIIGFIPFLIMCIYYNLMKKMNYALKVMSKTIFLNIFVAYIFIFIIKFVVLLIPGISYDIKKIVYLIVEVIALIFAVYNSNIQVTRTPEETEVLRKNFEEMKKLQAEKKAKR